MRIPLLLILICILVSGCGLFRKKTTIKNSALIEQKLELKESESEKVKLDVQQFQKVITLTDDKSKITTTLKGREIEITSTGIRCNDCEVNQSQDNHKKEQTDSTALLNSNLYYAKEADRRVNENLKNKSKDSKVEIKPEGSSFLWFSFSGAVIIIMLFYIWKKSRKALN